MSTQKKKSNSEILEFLRYIVIGVSTTALNWGITFIMTETFAMNATLSVIVAWTVSTVFFAFWMYKFFVFRSKSMEKGILWTEFAGFTGARLLTLGVEAVITFICCDLIGLDEMIHFGFTRMVDGEALGTLGINIRERYIVKLCACVITTILNYIFSKLIIFKKGQKKTLSEETDEGENVPA